MLVRTRILVPALLTCLASLGAAQSVLGTHRGESIYDNLGVTLGGQDLDGDGTVDYLVGAAGAGVGGVLTAYSGATRTVIWERFGASGDRFGHALDFTGDMDGDGVRDVVVGAPNAVLMTTTITWPGSVTVVSGTTGATILERFGPSHDDEMGTAVAGGFDWDRDGIEDFAGGAVAYGSPQADSGYVEVWSGANGATLFSLAGGGADRLGAALANVGDVNQDGFEDLCVGAPGDDFGASEAGSFWVRTEGQLLIEAFGGWYDGLGSTISAADDYDNDGHPDFLVGSPGWGTVLSSASGQVQLFSGDTGAVLFTWTAGYLDEFGASIARIGDVNGDGKQDFAVGALRGPTATGLVRVFSLKFGTELFTVNDDFGAHLAGLGDVNGDGVPDFAAAAPGWDGTGLLGVNVGEIQLISGGGPGFVNYCTAGTSASGCQAVLSGSGTPSSSAASGFTLQAQQVEGDKQAMFFYGWNGRQANPWSTGGSYQCVAPPVKRGGSLGKSGTDGQCDGVYAQDLNAYWQANPTKDPGPGAVVQAQLWFRDPQNTASKVTTSLSDAFEFVVGN